jgi:CubicO group peptidase (beta-lactamase class C family)
MKTKSIRKTLFLWTSRLILTLVMVIAALFLWAYLSTGTSLVARGILWGDSDSEDIYRFPTRQMQPGAEPVRFEPQTEDYLSQLPVTAEALQEGEIPFATLLEKTNTTAFIVLHGDQLLYEAYFNGSSRDAIQGSFSAAKSFTSTLIGIAIQ